MKIRNYKLGSCGIRILLLSDLHNKPYRQILSLAEAQATDMIAIAGDVTYGYKEYDRVAGFLEECRKLPNASGASVPVFLSLGNHDSLLEEGLSRAIAGSGVILLDDGYMDIIVKGVPLRIGGLTSHTPYDPACQNIPGRKNRKIRNPVCRNLEEMGRKRKPNTDWLSDFCSSESFKILLCHQPEYYPRYLASYPIDLILSGHAHGGQWRIPFTQQGVFAPGQGLLPKLTGGVTDNRLVISRGLSNTTWIPRFFNPREIVIVEI